MHKLIIAGVILIIVIILEALRKVYAWLPEKELKRQARSGNLRAKKLYKAVVYKAEIGILLSLLIILGISESLVLLSRSLNAWLFFLVVAIGILIFELWHKISTLRVEQSLTILLTPVLLRPVQILEPILRPIANWLDKFELSSGRFYQIEDIVSEIKQQASQPDNQIPKDQLDIAVGALSFGEKKVNEVMVPKRLVVSAQAKDAIGPVLMEELYKSGHSRFPVFEKKPEEVAGVLYLRDVVAAKKGGQVKDLMKKEVYYVHEEHTLNKVLNGFLKTKHHLFIVVNQFEEVVGIITIEDILEQILGKQIIDEFDQYDNLRIVAATVAKIEHDKKTTEVIE